MTTTEGMESMIDESQGTPRIATSVRVCADHETCERNKRAAFRKPQTCLTCERREATHFIADDSAYMLRCDECLVSNFGCPHAAPNVCPDCYDALTLDIYDALRSSSDVRMETLLSTLRAVEEAVREEHDPLIEWTADLPEMIRVQQSEHMRVLNATRNLAADNAAKWKSELSAALSRAERAETLARQAVDAVPQSWLDPILTGPDAVFDEKLSATVNVQRVLNAVRARITALTTPDDTRNGR
jgi:hypothetical protein